MAPFGYPVDDIIEMTHCKLHVKVVNISMKVAGGYALPIGPTPTYHYRPVPQGYAVVGVDEIMPTFEVLKLDYPVGERDVTELGDATNVTILWPKECIVLRNHTPRPSSPPPHPSPSPHQSPAQPSPRDPSLAPKGQKRKRTLLCLVVSDRRNINKSLFQKYQRFLPREIMTVLKRRLRRSLMRKRQRFSLS